MIAAINAALAESARWGFWKCFDRIHNLGHGWNHKRVYRVYCQMKLNLPRRTKQRVLNRVRQPLWVVPEMNVVWALDFMRDTLYGGKVFRTLNVIDEANRGALGVDLHRKLTHWGRGLKVGRVKQRSQASGGVLPGFGTPATS